VEREVRGRILEHGGEYCNYPCARLRLLNESSSDDLLTLMQPKLSEPTSRFGFVSASGGVHTGKTILLPELSLLLDAAGEDADYPEFRRLVVEENVLLKATATNRGGVFRALVCLYSLRKEILLFTVFRVLWQYAEEERPLLALLLASARDAGLRESASVVLQKSGGESIKTPEIQAVLQAAYGERYNAKTLQSMAEHLGASWVQSGHLVGRSQKFRAKAVAGPASVTYALFLGFLCGGRGILLYETFWSGLLDLSPEQMDAFAFAAAQRGWLHYRRMGQVAEITFPRFLVEGKEEEVGG